MENYFIFSSHLQFGIFGYNMWLQDVKVIGGYDNLWMAYIRDLEIDLKIVYMCVWWVLDKKEVCIEQDIVKTKYLQEDHH